MLIVETIGRIRREHPVQGKSIKEIARDLRIPRNTVRNTKCRKDGPLPPVTGAKPWAGGGVRRGGRGIG
jgi:hypothetical protein